MLSTLTSYRLLATDVPAAMGRLRKRSDIDREVVNYRASIAGIKSIDELLKNDRAYRFVMRAFGLDEMSYAKAFIRKVLSEGIDAKGSLANRLADNRYRELVETLNFARYGATATTFNRAQDGMIDRFLRQVLEAESGTGNDGVRLALYFERKASSVDSPYMLLADRALLKVTQVALGIPASASAVSVDRQAAMISGKIDITDLKDPRKLNKFIERFTVLWDLENRRAPAVLPISVLLQTETAAIDKDLLSRVQSLKRGV